MEPSLAFPAAESDDPEDVSWTLQTAGAMWARGDHQEAVRWLRRAAEAAADAGRDDRAVSLARSAADLSAALSLPRSVPPPLPLTPKPPPSVPRANYAPITPVDDIDTSADYTIPDAKPIMPPPRKRPAPSGAPPAVPPPRSSPSAPAPSRSSPSAAPPAASRSSPSTAPGPGFRPRQTLRVAVVPAPDDKNLLHVRVLNDEEQAPEGAHEALLTALEPGAHLLAKKR